MVQKLSGEQKRRRVGARRTLLFIYECKLYQRFFLFIHLLLFRDIRIAAQKVLWRGFSFCAVSVAVEHGGKYLSVSQ